VEEEKVINEEYEKFGVDPSAIETFIPVEEEIGVIDPIEVINTEEEIIPASEEAFTFIGGET